MVRRDRSVDIVTPWRNRSDLIADYAAATTGARVIIVDNASDNEEAALIRTFAMTRGVYIRSTENLGFARANNVGFAQAHGDIVVFLNNDIVADPSWLDDIRHDVRDGALYGPSLGVQFVAGVELPYLEGWCIAATRATWERLHGPWDARYIGPYWEDNDLCLRALEMNIALVHSPWSIRHKVGQTTGGVIKHAESFERNRARFVERALTVAQRLRDRAPTPIMQRYTMLLTQPSDIRHHLPFLFALARGNVVECGVRSGVSTTALVAGVEARGGHVWSIDIDATCADVLDHPQWTFVHGDSTDPSLVATVANGDAIDLVLLDTIHTYDHVARELELWGAHVRNGGVIVVHDTETFPGVRAAVEEACAAHGWDVMYILPDNGLAIIEVRR